MNGTSLTWFGALFGQQRIGDFAGSFQRSIVLGLLVMVLTVVISFLVGLAFRRRFAAPASLFYLAVASLIMPGILVSLGIGLIFQLARPQDRLVFLGLRRPPHLDAALRPADHVRGLQPLQQVLRRGGARPRRLAWQPSANVVLPIILPEPDRRRPLRLHPLLRRVPALHADHRRQNTLPIEIYAMTTNVTSPALYALGTLTTAFSFAIIALCLGSIVAIQRRRTRGRAA